jgi:hypothetical protein
MVLHPLEKLEAVMLGHEQVHDSKVIAVRCELGLRFLDSCNAFGSEPATFDQTLENTPDALLIIDYQYATIHTFTAYTITSGASNALPEPQSKQGTWRPRQPERALKLPSLFHHREKDWNLRARML